MIAEADMDIPVASPKMTAPIAASSESKVPIAVLLVDRPSLRLF